MFYNKKTILNSFLLLDSNAYVLDPSFGQLYPGFGHQAFADFALYIINDLEQAKATKEFGVLCENGK